MISLVQPPQKKRPARKCDKAFDNIWKANTDNSYASDGEGVGLWINAEFTHTMAIQKVRLLNRDRHRAANKRVDIRFGDSGLVKSAVLPVKGSREWNELSLDKSVITDRVNITVTEVYSRYNNGFKEIQFLGCRFDTDESNDKDDDDNEEEEDVEANIIDETSSLATPEYYTCNSTYMLTPGEITCTASSEFNSYWKCEKAFDGVLAIGAAKQAWASKGDGEGGWINAQFKRKMAISKLKILQRVQENHAVNKISIDVGGMTEEATLSVKRDKNWNVVELPRTVVAENLKITITEIYKNIQYNHGFKEIQIFGCPVVECEEEENGQNDQ